MHVHILGICGTFMGGVARIAKQLGHTVTGSDAAVYPPMSTQLSDLGIDYVEGYDPKHLKPTPDVVIIGNALSRGNPAVEAVLSQGIPYTSGAQWLADHALRDKKVLAVAGTHGKTTTSTILMHILQATGHNPSYLIGGVPGNNTSSAELTDSPYFVIEADEYDTAFYDKQSKFLHYRPSTLVLNNLEFDHADIFDDLAAIQKQFEILLRTVPDNGAIILNGNDSNLNDVIARGCWTLVTTFATSKADWEITAVTDKGFTAQYKNETAIIEWSLFGEHNNLNALAALAAAHSIGVTLQESAKALNSFPGVKRRCQVCGVVNNITVYDDFAHHPTAIATTVNGLRNRIADARIIVALEFASNTMQSGLHNDLLPETLKHADHINLLKPANVDWCIDALSKTLTAPVVVYDDVDAMANGLQAELQPGDHLLIMSNRSFGGLHERVLSGLGRV